MEMITYLKRRFSSGDLQGEAADKREQEGLPSFLRFGGTTAESQNAANYQQNSIHSGYRSQDPYVATGQYPTTPGTQRVQPTNEESSMRRTRAGYPSAPTSPARTPGSSFMGPMSSITGHISSTIMRGFSTAASTAQTMTGVRSKDKQKILLVIDDTPIDWSKYFRGHRILGDWDIRVEQAQFSEITMTAYSDQGCVINIHQTSARGKTTRSFKPDFVLLKQHVTEPNEDWQPILTGLMYGGTPCMNSLHAVYNMKNRPWLFAHLLLLRNRLGKETFPLITQTYYTCHKELVTAPAFPTIVKVGQGHGGEGKIRVDNPTIYQDLISVLPTANTYTTMEPFVDAKCDIHVQKIGNQYKAFARKSISGHWKSNSGSAILEKVPMNEKFKLWADEVARMFGGLDICSIEVLQSKTGEYFIYEVNGSDMTLFGDSQEEDRREIAELVTQRMQAACSVVTKTTSLQSISKPPESERPMPVSTATYQQPQSTRQSMPTAQTNIFQPSTQPPPRSMQAQPAPESQQPPWQSFRAPSTTSSSAPSSNMGVSWNEPSPSSSVGSSAYSGSSAYQPGSKMDGQITSGQATPTAVGEASRGGDFTSFMQRSLEQTYGSSSRGGYGGQDVQANVHTFAGVGGAERPLFTSADSFGMKQSQQQPSAYSAGSAYDAAMPERKISGGTVMGTQPPSVPARQTSLRNGTGTEEGDDTMKNLRKTFAGIFGDM